MAAAGKGQRPGYGGGRRVRRRAPLLPSTSPQRRLAAAKGDGQICGRRQRQGWGRRLAAAKSDGSGGEGTGAGCGGGRWVEPGHRSVPILIHRGRPICGSINILEYIDEVWAKRVGTRLLPSDPLERASTRFWADFVVHKGKGEEKEVAKAELLDQLRRLEGVLGDRSFFSGDEFGFLDIVLIPFSSTFHGYEQHGGFDLKAECPFLMQWVKRCKERESVRQVLPDEGEMYELHKKWYGIE
uniref:Glutathione S-transferase n=1 Tax=Oryza meridionalis TaxID=40149 RepID=A0A0E0E7I8_9ORYZ